MSHQGIDFLLQLEAVIDARRSDSKPGSYTAELFAAGSARIAQKVGEEAVELALASVGPDPGRIGSEAADLVFHLLVLLRQHSMTLADVARELERRHKPDSG